MSPTLFRIGTYRFYFFSREENRMHIHVVGQDGEAKFWIEPEVELAAHTGLSDKELTKLRKLIEERKDEIVEAWEKYFRA